jgi:hypothetical protein
VVVRAANDPRPDDRIRCAHDAAGNVAAGEPAYGYPKLREILGDQISPKLSEWLGLGSARSGPIIRLTTDLTAAAEEAERVMLGAGLPLYRRGAELVRPLLLDAHTFCGDRIKTIGLISVPTILLRSYMGQATGFERYDGRSKDWIPTKAPIDVAELILSRAGHWPFPEIRGVLAAPSMRRLNPAPARV